MISKLINMYEKGAITAHHLVLECLDRIDPANPGIVLSPLSHEMHMRMLDHVREYRHGEMVSNYGNESLPTVDQVEAARAWLEAKLTQSQDMRVGEPAA